MTPSVILLRLNAQGMMVMTDALPDLRIEGKPQCHIIAVAHEARPRRRDLSAAR